jgi:hypothetical protein
VEVLPIANVEHWSRKGRNGIEWNGEGLLSLCGSILREEGYNNVQLSLGMSEYRKGTVRTFGVEYSCRNGYVQVQ